MVRRPKTLHRVKIPADLHVSVEAANSEIALQKVLQLIKEKSRGFDLGDTELGVFARLYVPMSYLDEVEVIQED